MAGKPKQTRLNKNKTIMNRRLFIGRTLAATTAGALFTVLKSRAEDKPAALAPVEYKRKIKLGVVG